MVDAHVRRELTVYGGVGAAVVVGGAILASHLAAFPARYVLLPLVMVMLCFGALLAGASGSGPGLVGEGNVSGESGEGPAGDSRGSFIPGDSSTGVVPSIHSRPVVFLVLGVAFWGFLALVALVALG